MVTKIKGTNLLHSVILVTTRTAQSLWSLGHRLEIEKSWFSSRKLQRDSCIFQSVHAGSGAQTNLPCSG